MHADQSIGDWGGLTLCVGSALSLLVMICATAATRPASAGEMGRKARERREDGAEITHSDRQTWSLCWTSSQGKHSLHAAQPHQEELREPGFPSEKGESSQSLPDGKVVGRLMACDKIGSTPKDR
jgi:hypothetical protein